MNTDLISTSPATSKIIHRVSLGSLAGLLGQGINIARQILLVPLFLWAWGTQLYGEWLALYAVVAYLSLLDFGMQMYVVNRLNQCYSVKQLNDYTRILHSALVLYLSVAVVAGCLIAVAVFVVPIEQWLNFKLMGHSTTTLVTVLFATQLILAIPQGLIIGLYATFREFPRGAMIRNLQQVCMFGFMALVLLLGGSVIYVAAIQLIPLVGVIAFVLYDLKKRHPEVKIGLSESDWRLAITFLGPSLLFFLIQISMGFTIQGSVLVVSAFVGSSYVAMFVIHRTLTTLIRQITAAFNFALWPELTALEARGEYDKLRTVHRLSVKLFFALSVFTGIWLHFAGKDIIKIWTLNKIIFDQRLFDIFLLYVVIQIPYQTSGIVLVASNRHKNPCICSIVSAVLGLGLALFLVRYLGIAGVALGLLIADVLTCVWFIPLNTCRILGDSIRKYWMEVIVRGLPVVAVLWGLAWYIGQLGLSPKLYIFATGSIIVLVGIGIGYFLWLSGRERVQVLSIGTALWNKVVSLNLIRSQEKE